MLVEWKPGALADLKEILGYIAVRNPQAADALYADIDAATSALPQHPYLYRYGRVSGTR